MQNIDEILPHAAGVLLSRTFQILDNNTKTSITRITKYLIAKCREFDKPIYSNIDVTEDFLCLKKQKIVHLNEIIHNALDRMDGFFLSTNNDNAKLDPEYCIQKNPDQLVNTINYFINYLRTIHKESNLKESLFSVNKQL